MCRRARADRPAAGRYRLTAHADRLPRPPAPRRARHRRGSVPHGRQRRALPRRRDGARHRRARRLRARVPLPPGAVGLGSRPVAPRGARRPRRVLRVRARGDRPAPGHRGRLHPRARGPDGDAPGGARLGLRGGLGPLPRRRGARPPRLRHLGAQRVAPREGLGALLRVAGGGGPQRPVRHPRPPRPREDVGPDAPAPRRRPAPLLRDRDGGHRRVGDRRRGLDRRPAQAGRRAVPGDRLPGDGRRGRQPDRPLQRRPPPRAPRLRLRPGDRGPRVARRARARRVRAPHPPAGADRPVVIGHGYDSHRFAPGRRLVLGGVEIAHDEGLLGHSDADVLTHAIMDALLGAAGLGDIGHHFPDTDERWRDADSVALLREVVAMLARAGLEPVNVDATVVLERPKVGPHRDAIRARLAEALGLPAARVNVKATTAEGMGPIGRGEGAEAHAVALLRER
ncbi:MAG: 2-C-methyl-D-erythritol 2,4-cyclodiphosphate synthase [Solirubrobacteraceae bacterium]|nr:2-C-methyl-D-erythritol 2,4-cyclodiphosphate synthase [Solirubrobacteraceae bacterium]